MRSGFILLRWKKINKGTRDSRAVNIRRKIGLSSFLYLPSSSYKKKKLEIKRCKYIYKVQFDESTYSTMLHVSVGMELVLSRKCLAGSLGTGGCFPASLGKSPMGLDSSLRVLPWLPGPPPSSRALSRARSSLTCSERVSSPSNQVIFVFSYIHLLLCSLWRSCSLRLLPRPFLSLTRSFYVHRFYRPWFPHIVCLFILFF